jgi:L-threonylcarbamoyladenylate synthase
MTAMLRVDPATCEPQDLGAAAAWLRSLGVVAFPTDTLYGLAVDPTSVAAVAAVFDLKGRGVEVALPLVAASTAQVEAWCGPLRGATSALARAFWPGPLSLIFDAPPQAAPAVHGGGGTVAIRVPESRVARGLAAAFGQPVTATSANRSGERPAASIAGLGDLVGDPRVLVIDGGVTPGGAPSTIVDARSGRATLVREGAISWNRVLESLKK